MPDALPLEGDYVVVLKESMTGRIPPPRGSLREAKSRWPRRFQSMIEEQARFADGRPAERARREGEPLLLDHHGDLRRRSPVRCRAGRLDLGQRHDDFEWVLLDNGSHRSDTQQTCRDVAARDPRIRFWRVEDNLHIIGGNRFPRTRAAPTSSPSMGTISFTRTHCGSEHLRDRAQSIRIC